MIPFAAATTGITASSTYDSRVITASSSSGEHPLKSDLKRVADAMGQLGDEKRARAAEVSEQQAHARAVELDTNPLTNTVDAWKTAEGPRLDEALLRKRLQKYRVPEVYRSDSESALGGECVDLFAFVKGEIFAEHTRQKEVMRGAQLVCKSS